MIDPGVAFSADQRRAPGTQTSRGGRALAVSPDHFIGGERVASEEHF